MPRGKPSFTKGKVVDRWTYEYTGLADDDGQEHVTSRKVEIVLKLHKKLAESNRPPMATKEVWFSVECAEPEIKLSGSDVEALRAAMWEQLDDAFEVKWSRYFLVQITQAIGMATLVFDYTRVEKGVAHDGALLLRRHDLGARSRIEPWPGKFKNSQGKVIACIEATDANREALEEFAKNVDELRKKLQEFLMPQNIEWTLANLSQLALGATEPPPERD